MRQKLTKRLIKSIHPEAKAVLIHDTDLPGFQCRIAPNGKAVFYLYYRTKNGRQRRPSIGVYGVVSCDQARKTALTWLAAVAQGADPSQSRQQAKVAPTIADLAERYLEEHARPNKKPRSVTTDQSLLRNHVLPAMGPIKVADLSRADVYVLRNKLKHTPGAANRCLALLSKMMNLAEKWGLRADGSNPVRHVEKFKGRKIERYLSGAELVRLGQVLETAELMRLEHPTVVPAIRLLLFTGCRLGEILNLEWSAVDLENSCLRLKDSKTGPKTIHLPGPALEVLAKLGRSPYSPFVIYGRHQKGQLVGLSRPWYRLRKQAGLEDVRLHDLRHTFASIGVSAGLSLPIIGRLLGHTQTQTTARYAHLYVDPLKEAVELVGSRLAQSLLGGTSDPLRN
ncbi:MAG: tyrosine-type recombinase/integrase [Elusimicrobia bacterium]|nr:tyrosine-type recombinase/integrase [Elusimicrobiota bacterium]